MFPVSRRELLGRTVLGVQILLLAACGGDDEDDAEQPRAAPTAPQASVPRVTKEQIKVRLASVMDQFDRVVRSAIEQWNEGGVPGAPEGTMLERMGGPSPSVAPSRNILVIVESAQAATRTFLTEQESAGTPPDLFLFNRFFDFPLGLPQRSCPAAGPVPAAGPDGAIGELPAIRAGISPLPEPNDGAAGRP